MKCAISFQSLHCIYALSHQLSSFHILVELSASTNNKEAIANKQATRVFKRAHWSDINFLIISGNKFADK